MYVRIVALTVTLSFVLLVQIVSLLLFIFLNPLLWSITTLLLGPVIDVVLDYIVFAGFVFLGSYLGLDRSMFHKLSGYHRLPLRLQW